MQITQAAAEPKAGDVRRPPFVRDARGDAKVYDTILAAIAGLVHEAEMHADTFNCSSPCPSCRIFALVLPNASPLIPRDLGRSENSCCAAIDIVGQAVRFGKYQDQTTCARELKPRGLLFGHLAQDLAEPVGPDHFLCRCIPVLFDFEESACSY